VKKLESATEFFSQDLRKMFNRDVLIYIFIHSIEIMMWRL